MKLEFVPPWELEARWPEVAPFLAKALATQSAMSLESVHADVRGGKFLLWEIAGRAAFVTQVQQFALEKICMVVLCGGNEMEAWLAEADRSLTHYAKFIGCQALMIVGCKGWSRVVPEYHIEAVVMRKPL